MTISDLLSIYSQRRDEIQLRLRVFDSIEFSSYFYELCYCLLTPQSKAHNANIVVQELQRLNFYETGADIVHVLRAPSHYIRFHNTKAARLQRLRLDWESVPKLLDEHGFRDIRTDWTKMRVLRTALCKNVTGIGMKEASHFLRNIGGRGLAIIDRHLISNMLEFEVLTEEPKLGSVVNYEAVESKLERFANSIGIDMDELDLVFWSIKTGVVLK